MTRFLTTPAKKKTSSERQPHVFLAHGAGAPMTSSFLETTARLLSDQGLTVTRFEFDYMAARRADGKRRPPPRAEKLVCEFIDTFDIFRKRENSGAMFLIGGKSMGGRVASMAADQLYADGQVQGVVCLGYPFHPPKKPDKLRVFHLEILNCPALIVQGERDPFGGQEDVSLYKLPDTIRFHWCPDGDHDLKPRVRSGFSLDENLADAAAAIAAFSFDLKGAHDRS